MKHLVAAGLGSRRACAQLVMAGRVQVNGQTVDSLAYPVGTGGRVSVDGSSVDATLWRPTYLLLHKPPGYLTTVHDDRGRRTVMDLVPHEQRTPGLAPVGRLDMGTTGLLLLTNDGGLAYRLTHPRYGVEREYVAVVDRPLMGREMRRLVTGIQLPEGPARAEAVKPLARRVVPGTDHRRAGAGHPTASLNTLSNSPRYAVTLVEGRKREIRLMFQAIGHQVRELRRVRMGTIRLGSLATGQLRTLSPAEVQQLKGLVARARPGLV